MSRDSPPAEFTPLTITTIYLLAGGAWVALSDRVAAALFSGELYLLAQTAKGWLFVAGSGVLLFGLVTYHDRQLRHTNDRLERALQQVSILHRIVRHNLRNSCNVILGNADNIRSERGDCEELENIRSHVETLVALSDKSSKLTDVVMGRDRKLVNLDLVEVVRQQVENARSAYPDARIELETTGRAEVRVLAQFDVAIAELIENAIEHNESETAVVRLSVFQNPEGSVVLDVVDDGPGVPEMEKIVLEEGMERPLTHSEGLGLWLVRMLVVESGGRLRVIDDEPSGTIVRLLFESEGDADSVETG